ncbi:hypothetical protein PGTUg99_000508 [Puccinia graminis f. sp. tritici]|uniref:Uncharacterized protein n=1 Tax=Puccinia graminis f. sp. tritici TaxID=56615 RepID=A0A5B0RGT8_PUCGR|nr:hypothetical protein PGTUg99_000508 [Puccinia graminis f. sp. tritici]
MWTHLDSPYFPGALINAHPPPSCTLTSPATPKGVCNCICPSLRGGFDCMPLGIILARGVQSNPPLRATPVVRGATRMSSAGRDLMSQRLRVSSSNGLAVLHPWTNQPPQRDRPQTTSPRQSADIPSTPQGIDLDDAFIGRFGGCNIELGVWVGVFVEDFGNRGREVTRRSQRSIAGWSAPGMFPGSFRGTVGGQNCLPGSQSSPPNAQ